MHIVLYQPRIPPNTGAIARLCAATRTPLHLVGPLGFSLDDKYLKRAGLDYWEHVELTLWKNWEEYRQNLDKSHRLIMTSARQGADYTRHSYSFQDHLILGPETWGLPEKITSQADHLIRIPIWGEVRSLNLSNAAGIILYEGYRQLGMPPAHF
ncbi:tRNA/rRNA methyltransferase (SpoU) [Desulfonatronospira thiodismutans ASO3-1]|uniref:Putative tRNA (cytidine(34)-2'-O)-methyltransferase n=1 Tax=Desulfonatronospira thiodismutans ASO3-1 TaxID=555779 RepID=D6SMU4_9BACT|nr:MULTISPECIES: tRNA (cytidine(34)-2'-O)-methyltransferase [Desulfonatronospira]EFI36005.1 tRNA/rRNA methyltransferase (SpoU) [Desulfonatronospira thiodismutans ASO3-1]RQD77883.1 MAG: tRNA (cytidine(34)-2'-O)-methyltransferase [Desulfonatronospira sp. MSAO_Bac3]